MRTRAQNLFFGALALLIAIPTFAAEPIRTQGNPPAASFNKLHTYEEIVDLLKGYAAAYPRWTRLESIGKSGQDRSPGW